MHCDGPGTQTLIEVDSGVVSRDCFDVTQIHINLAGLLPGLGLSLPVRLQFCCCLCADGGRVPGQIGLLRLWQLKVFNVEITSTSAVCG